MSEDDDYHDDLNNLFDENNTCYNKSTIAKSLPLEDSLALSFSRYLLPFNHLKNKEEEENERILTLSKFKELKLNKVKEDMLYYCSPVDILSKLDTNNSEYLLQESDSEFYNELSITSFLQRQNELIELMKEEKKIGKIEKYEKSNNLENIDNLSKSKHNLEKEDLNRVNELLKNIQKTMKLFMKEKNVDVLLKSLKDIFNNVDKLKINIELIGFDKFIIIENNLALLIGIIEKMFSKNEEELKKFIEEFIEILQYIKSNRLFFIIIQLLNKYKNIKTMKILENCQIISDESVDLIQMINSIKFTKTINIKSIDDFLRTKGYTVDEKSFAADNNFWTVNNKEELFIFRNKPNNKLNDKNIFFFKINIRKTSEDDNIYKLLDFGKINLSNNDDDLIFEINISIKNDLIYICYLVNKKLNSSEENKDSFEVEFGLYYQIYSTSMLLLKEGLIKINDFDCLNSTLYSDQKYLYVISDKSKLFILKKDYSMDNYKYNKFIIKSKEKDVSITDYRYHNCFNLNNIILLESKSNNEELLMANFTKKDDEYVLNIIDINKTKREKQKEQYHKYKISYCDDIFLLVKIDYNIINLTKPDFTKNNLIDNGIQFLPFNNSSNCYLYNSISDLTAYKRFLMEFSTFVNLYGNFDLIKDGSVEIVEEYPYSLCLNINLNNFNFLIDQMISKDVDMETKLYSLIIIKQFICCLYNSKFLKNEQLTKFIEYLKQFVLDINKNYKDDNLRKYINKLLKEIIFISSYLNEQEIIKVEEIKNLINDNNELSFKTKMLLLDLLLSQPNTQQNPELFNIVFEFDKTFLCYFFEEKPNKKNVFSNYKLYKNIMNKALVLMENHYREKNNETSNKELFALIEKITKNIEQICKIYEKNTDKELCQLPIFFYSINFTFFYLILQRLISNNYLDNNTDILTSLYNILLLLDKLDINTKFEKCLDLNNVLEIKNVAEGNEGEEEESFYSINFKTKQNIIFKTNLTKVDDDDLNKYMEIKLLKNEEKKTVPLNLNDAYEFIHYDVDGIKIKFKNVDKKFNQLVLNVIPVKDEKEYLKFRKYEIYNIINLLKKIILHYFLFLFKTIEENINNFFEKQNINNFYKHYQTEFLQYIYTNNINIDDSKEEEEKKEEEVIANENEKLIDKIYHLLNFFDKKNDILTRKNNIKDLCDKFISLFCKINNKETKTKINLESFYRKDEESIQKILSYKDINLSDPSFTKLIEQFNSDISKKKKLMISMQSNESINKMILKIFQIIIKYYNYNDKLYALMKNITINDDYTRFCEIYEACCQMKIVYNQEKSRFADDKFEEQSQNYINTTMDKLDFIYKIIIPSFDENIKYDKLIVKNLIDLIKNQNFSPKETIKYSEIQNLNYKIKVIELLIINNLLLNLNGEDSLRFILYIINERYNKNSISNNYSISMSFLDSYGADFAQIEQVKNQFHLLIEIITDKYIMNKNIYDKLSMTTKISLYQSLLWKYKGRDFNILPKIVKCFEDLQKYKLTNENNNIFEIEHEKIFRINNYDLNSFYDMKFEIFKIIISQVFIKIKENLDNIKEIKNDLNLVRKVSTITDYKDIVNSILSFFTLIKKGNKYYHELILFFYKNVINSKKLINLIINSYSEVIVKIFDIIFDDNNDNKDNKTNDNRDNKDINTKLILLKLLLQILENIDNEDKTANLAECCIQYDKNGNYINEDFNPFEFLFSKFNTMLNKEENSFLKYYYFKIFIFCLNRIDINNSKIDKKNILNINLLLFFYNNLAQIESEFLLKNEYSEKFEDNALFCHLENNRTVKSGNLLCFINNKSLFNDYLNNRDVKYFNCSDFVYNVEQKENAENFFAIMKESLDGKINKIKCIEKRNIEDIILVNNKNSNIFYSNYLKNNSSYIYDELINKLISGQLNYRGINCILKLIMNLLDYIKIENAETIIKYIFQYINDEKVIKNEKEWECCSLEYFINEMNSFQNIFDYSSFNINNETKKNEEKKDENGEESKNENSEDKKGNMEAPLILSSLFNYIIRNNDLCIEYKSNTKMNNIFSKILTKINDYKDKEKKDNKNNSLLMTNLSFYNSHQINTFTKITDNSLLLIEKLSADSELLKIIDENKSKIKAIITSEKKDETSEEFKEFISKISLPIYLVKKEFYDKFITFFVEGVGGEYIPPTTIDSESKTNIIPIYRPLMLINKNGEKENNNVDDDFNLNKLFAQSGEIPEILNDKEKNKKLIDFEKNIKEKYADITFDLQKVYCIENIKLCYRILYELLSRPNILHNIKYELLNNNLEKLLEIFYSLCDEYYFNISKKFSINYLQNLLKKYIQTLSSNNTFCQKWHEIYMNNFSIQLNNKDNNDFKCKEYDKLLFIFRENSKMLLDENSINLCLNAVNDIIEKSIKDIDPNAKKLKVPNRNIKTNIIFKDEFNFIPYFLYEILNEIYNNIINNKPNSKLFIKCFINNNLNNSIIKFIDEVIEIKNYLKPQVNDKQISKGKTMLVQFGLKYLDICFYIFFKEKKYNLIDYWIKSNNDLFLFYSSYKILSTERHYEESDYKELLTIIAYISDSINCFYENKNEKHEEANKLFKMKMNNFNKLDLKQNNKLSNDISQTIITSFSFDGLTNSINKNINYKKLAIFIYNKETKKYSLQDIIDTSDSSDIKQNLINYKQYFNNEEIFLVPLNSIETSLYACGNNFNHALGIKGQLSKYYDKPTKCEGLPKNIWHISYGNNYCLALSEEDNQIYACGCNKGGGFNSTPRPSFTSETRINNFEENSQKNKNKYIKLATGNCDSSLLFSENLELYGIGNNEKKIFGLNDKKLKYPTKLELSVYENRNREIEENNIIVANQKTNIGKIKSFYIGYFNSYIINDKGKLFGLGNNSSFQISGEEDLETYTKWKNIPLPENCKKFVDCAVGEKYIICLIEDENGNNKLYAQGNNEFNQCGIVSDPPKEPIRTLTICDKVKNLSFKKIYTRNSQCAAITNEGDLYIWGKTNFNNNGEEYRYPTLVLFDSNHNVEKVKNIVGDNDNNLIKTLKKKVESLSKSSIINEENKTENNKTIVDEVAICRSHMLIIARKYENGSYTRKLFGYGDNSKGALGLPIDDNNETDVISIKEIPLLNEKNEKLIPIKLAIGDNKSYILCVNENELIQRINNEKTKEDNADCEINVSNIYIEKLGKNLLDFYNSKNLTEFINLFRAITNKAITEYIDVTDEIKMSQENKKPIIKFKTFLDYLSKYEITSELSRIFIQSELTNENKQLNEKKDLISIFNYLNTKSAYIANEIFNYCSTNEKSEYKAFLQKAIGNNISYLNAEKRLQKFNELLSKYNLKRGTERRVEVDRFKANMFYNNFNQDPKNRISDLEFNKTIFGQVYQSFGKTKGEDFLIQKGRRLFIVCLKNEYASDSGGPYHEVISGICQELQSDYLNMFIKTPNSKHDMGLLRDKYIPNPQATREINEKTFEFLGKIMASAITSGEAMELNLHPIVWKALLGNEMNYYEYETIDCTFYNLIKNLEKELNLYEEKKNNNEEFEEKYKLNFVIKNSNEEDIELKPEGEKYAVTLDNLKEYISLSKKMRVNEFVTQIGFIKKGFNSVIPSSIFQVLHWKQLEEMVCGKNTLDVRDLKKHTRYDGFNEKDEIILWFWEWLEECNEHEKSLYLKFVSGRTRLPKEKNFNYEHVIVKNNINAEALPHSATCFFTLKLPLYKDKETLRKKLSYSIFNCDEIDGDH